MSDGRPLEFVAIVRGAAEARSLTAGAVAVLVFEAPLPAPPLATGGVYRVRLSRLIRRTVRRPWKRRAGE